MHPNAKVSPENSLWNLREDIAKQWIAESNSGLLPEDVGRKSQKPFAFACVRCNQLRLSSPGNICRSLRVTCSSCSRILVGLSNQKPRRKTVADSPELLSRWDFQKNSTDPFTVASKSNRKFYWLCEFGHSTFAPVHNREGNKRGCAVCTEHFHTSKGERELSHFIQSIYKKEIVLNSRSIIHPYEIDISLPEDRIALEFNGAFYHSERFINSKSNGLTSARDQHERKRDLTLAAGFQFGIVWEDDWYGDNKHKVEEALKQLIFKRSLSEILDRMTLEEK